MVNALKEKGLGASEIAKQLGIGRASVYRVLEMGRKAAGNSDERIEHDQA